MPQEHATFVRDGETPQMLSARLGVPICAVLRANRLVCAAWLTPGRKIAIPTGDFCQTDTAPCPVSLFLTPARIKPGEVCIANEEDTVAALASEMSTTERLFLLSRGRNGSVRDGERIVLDTEICKKRIGSVLPGEGLERACERLHVENIEEVKRLNRLADGRVWPGMRLVLPD